MRKQVIRIAGAALVASLSTVAWAGGPHGGGHVVMRPGGFGGGHWGGGFHAMPPVAGTIHVRPNGGNYFSGYGHTNTALGGRPVPGFYGHTNTAFGGRPGGWQPAGGSVHGPAPAPYGHTNTAFGVRPGPGFGWHPREGYRAPAFAALPNGSRSILYRRGLIERRFGPADRFALLHRTLRYGHLARYRYGVVGSGYGGYSVDLSAAPSYGGYVEAPLASSYGEVPLNQVFGAGGGYSYGGSAPTASYAPAADYAPSTSGGPQVIVINNSYAGTSERRQGCACSRDPRPVVYRFGVGSYY